MIDHEILNELKKLQFDIVRRMNESGIYGRAATPTIGHLARVLLRERLGIATSEA
ncbi:hypothetical protein EC07798_2865 [Escherichia coli 07798]|nr:hypothetical protein EC07798_2865 [Escherichia coli 07798]